MRLFPRLQQYVIVVFHFLSLLLRRIVVGVALSRGGGFVSSLSSTSLSSLCGAYHPGTMACRPATKPLGWWVSSFLPPTMPTPTGGPPGMRGVVYGRPRNGRYGSRGRSNTACGSVRSYSSGAFRRSVLVMMPEGPEVRDLVEQLRPSVGMRLADLRFLSGGRYHPHDHPYDSDENIPYPRQRQRQRPTGLEEFWKTMSVSPNGKGGPNEDEDIDIIRSWNAKGKFIWMVLDDGKKDGNRRTEKMPEEDNGDTGSASMVEARRNGDGNGNNNNDYLRSIWITLGMTGRFVRENTLAAGMPSSPPPHARWYLEFVLQGGDDMTTRRRKIYYCDQRNFGTLRFSLSRKELDSKLGNLGPDILDDTLDDDVFLDVIKKFQGSSRKTTMNVCRFLMNQSKLAGVGNYLLAESLWRARIDPFGSLDELDKTQTRRLVREVRATARESFSSLRRAGGSRHDKDFRLSCYGRTVDPNGEAVRKETDGPHGRTIWYVESQLVRPRAQRLAVASGLEEGRTNDDDANDNNNNNNDSDEAVGTTDVAVDTDMDAVTSLQASLRDESWREALHDVMESDAFARLANTVASERAKFTVYPPEAEVFEALNRCPLNRTKVVVVGQDPYHGKGQGHGLAFSVRKGVAIPPSLRNIFRELEDDQGISPTTLRGKHPHGDLGSWADQGVLLLNTVLTVRDGQPNSHAGIGWEEFTDAVVRALVDRHQSSTLGAGAGAGAGLVFLLWGKPAARKADALLLHTRDEASPSLNGVGVVRSSHPSPLAATRTATPFLGSKCFRKCNAMLEAMGRTPVDWTLGVHANE